MHGYYILIMIGLINACLIYPVFNLWSFGLIYLKATEAGKALNTNKLIDLPTEPEGGTQSVVNHCSNVTEAVIGIS